MGSSARERVLSYIPCFADWRRLKIDSSMLKHIVKTTFRPLWRPVRRRFEYVAGTQNAATIERLDRAEERLAIAVAEMDRMKAQIDKLSCDLNALTPGQSYEEKIQQELRNFTEVSDVHALPAIYGYWSNKHLLPMFRECGFAGVDEFYAKSLFEAAQRVGGSARFISIGAGNCDTEVRVACLLRDMGLRSFVLECLELNPSMLERGRQDAAANEIEGSLTFTQADFNAWIPTGSYTGAMANHSLHHVTNLEGLFDSIKSSLHPRGYFVTSDMIGRNGHQRWPEALVRVEQFWGELPEERRYNHLLRRHEPTFVNWDCSSEGFEGIRAQDILPLLVERFDFQVFLGFANVITPFIDRCFGHNFDAESPSDQALIDRIHAIDEDGFQSGELKPTQMLAVMSPEQCRSPVYARGLSPLMSIRRPD